MGLAVLALDGFAWLALSSATFSFGLGFARPWLAVANGFGPPFGVAEKILESGCASAPCQHVDDVGALGANVRLVLLPGWLFLPFLVSARAAFLVS